MLAQQIFTLTFPHAIGVIIGFGAMYARVAILCFESVTISISGSTAAAFIAMLGPRFGMRTMIITRYAFGYWGATFVCLLNILTEVRSQYSSHVILSPMRILLLFASLFMVKLTLLHC
jgi:hypothetical protein